MEYEIVLSSWSSTQSREIEALLAAALSMNGKHWYELETSGGTSIRVPDCFSLKYVFELDSTGVVLVNVKREERA